MPDDSELTRLRTEFPAWAIHVDQHGMWVARRGGYEALTDVVWRLRQMMQAWDGRSSWVRA